MVFELGQALIFPPPELANPDGLLALGGDLNMDRLLQAYSSGIFPWYEEGSPILWWSPDPRPIFIPGAMKVSKSLKLTLRKKTFEVCINRDFEAVLSGCAHTPRKGITDTWLTEEMMQAYLYLHRHGYAHSIETRLHGELVGGLYGLSLGKAFFGESMFFTVSNASKVAFYHLSEFLKSHNFHFIDGQVSNTHLLSLGAIEIPRSLYLQKLEQALSFPTTPEIWQPKTLDYRP